MPAYRAVIATQDAWQKAFGAITDDTANKVRTAQNDAATARRERDSLRSDLNTYLAAVRASTTDPAAGGGREAATAPLDLLADLFSRADDRAGALAEYADSARIAGQSCQRRYEALIAGNPGQ